jgi:arylsulfatase A-like enzyme
MSFSQVHVSFGRGKMLRSPASNRRAALLPGALALGGLLFGLLPGRMAAVPAKRPNVLLIVIDTARADHFSAYGYPRATSPNIDRLAAEGTLYERAISAASWTLPAHASLFTGLQARDHGTDGNHWTLEASFDTLAERLRRAGYRTGGFSNNVWTNDTSGLKQGFETFEEMWQEQKSRGENITLDDPGNDMGAAKTNERIFAWLDGRSDRRPFFAFVNYFEPHMPYRPTAPYDDDFLPAGVAAADLKRLRSFYSPQEYAYILRVPTIRIDEGVLATLVGLYDGEIAYVDSVIGNLVEGLRSRKLLDDTLIVITSDHGEHFGEHHMLEHKFSLYEPLLHVPLILRAPGRVAANVRIPTPVAAQDLYGSVLELAGVEAGKAPVLPRQALPASDAARLRVFSELEFPKIFLDVARRKFSGFDIRRLERSLVAVRGPRYKLIAGSDGTLELFDLAADPGENRNIAAEEPGVAAELKAAVDAFVREAPQKAASLGAN